MGPSAVRSSQLLAKGTRGGRNEQQQQQQQQEPKIMMYSQLCLGAGLTSWVVAMAYRRVKKEHPARHGPSRRSLELTRGGTPAHITEHIARIGDPEYICLSIAENKLTVGPLLEKLRELGAATAPSNGERRQKRSYNPRPRTPLTGDANTDLNVAGDSTDIDSAEECATFITTAAAISAAAARAGASTVPVSHAADEHGRASLAPPSLTSSSSSNSLASAPSSSTAAAAWARLSSMGYGDVRGPLWVRWEIARMMGRRIFHRESVDPDNVVIAAGATSVLRLLVLALSEEGEGCLIPGPYFPGFDKVLNIAGARAWIANSRAPSGAGGGGLEGGLDEGISPRVLQEALRLAKASGVHIRMLLITSPHNPTGRLYSAKALLDAVAWGRKRGLHIIVDEVYANCIHRPNAQFRSVGSLLMGSGAAGGPQGLGDDVHILYGLSKDLGVAGWRVGVLYSENKKVVAMVAKMAHSSQASSDTMDLVGRLFQEAGFMEDFFRQHQEGLRAAYVSLVNQLGRRGILHLQAEAGHFALLDLREFLEDSSEEAEQRLWRQMLERTKVNLTPGGAFHCVEPGWFRLCFAYQQVDVVSRAVDRVADFLQELVKERLAAVELEKQQRLRQMEQRLRELQQRRPLGEALAAAASAAASASVALLASATGYASTAARTVVRPLVCAAKERNKAEAPRANGRPNGRGASSSGRAGGAGGPRRQAES
ncbi:unnamed protein product, partial [Scytosiphon promiscuus]